MLGTPVHVVITAEFSDETSLLVFLGMKPEELKKVWYFRDRMCHNFDVAKKVNKARQIKSPNQRFKFFQHLIAGKLDTLYRRRSSVHG